MVKALKFDKKYIISPLLMVLGIFLAFASKVLLPDQINSFWRVLAEVIGYGFIAVGCVFLGIIGKTKE